MILFRYLTREVFTTLCLITGLLFFILMSNEFVHYLNQVAGGKFAANILWQLIFLESPRFLTILLPFSLFLAILFTYGRLYADYEMTTLNASGFGLIQLARLTLPLIIALSVVVTLLNIGLNPLLINYRNKLLAEKGTAIELQTVQPGSFQPTNAGRRIIYVETISPDHKLAKNLFMAQINSNDRNNNTDGITPWTLLTAKSGYQKIDRKTGEPYFIAVDGKRYQGIPGEKEYYITTFKNYGIRIGTHIGIVNNPQESLPTTTLLHPNQSNRLIYSSELQWRLAAPIATLLLALLAIPLSRVNPRQGKYLHLLPAILIYILYLNLLLFGRNWIENGDIPYHWGLWWIHGLLLLITLIIWGYSLGWNRIKYAFNHFLKFRKL